MYHVVAIELDDVVPRRCPALPNLYVGVTVQKPAERLRTVTAADATKWYSGHVIRLRQDLIENQDFPNRGDAKSALAQATVDLAARGFTVNRNCRVWSVYVIELNSAAIHKSCVGYVYVGETHKSHSQRFTEHMTRARNSQTRLYSPVVARHGVRLRPDLVPGGVLYSKEASKAAESAWADHLRGCGYEVEGGH